MSKIYRLHKGATDTIRDWTQINSYLDAAQIDNIPDPSGANAKMQITSIPSPFARIDLVKTAFKSIVASGNPTGSSIYHKMVSDALDVGQTFFNIARLADKIEIIAWNPGLSWVAGKMMVSDESDLGQLIHSASPSQRLYGETLRMFFSQDAAEYNFDLLQQFYLLNYKKGQGWLNMIGGTSPATLFFSSANNHDYVQLEFGQDKLFDEVYCPLQDRNEDYILFLYSLRVAMPGFRTRFHIMDAYLELCLPLLRTATKEKVILLESSNYCGNYNPISIAGEGNHPEIGGFELRGIKINNAKPQEESDFVIAATQVSDGLLPLVLPAYTFTGGLNYVDGKWPSNLKAPYFDPLPLAERILPGLIIKYPYLTVSDLLEPFLIRLPFQPNEHKFFNGNFPKGTNEGYLLPVTQMFFRYFKSEDLLQPLMDGQPMFEFVKLSGNAVKAKLRIPLKSGRFIDMERIYETDMAQAGYTDPDLSRNRGIIREQQFSIVIYPFVKRGTDDNAAYTIMLLDHDRAHTAARSYQLKYYKNSVPQQPVAIKAQRQKSNKQQDLVDTIYDVVQSEFDFITVERGKTRGCLIPLFPVKPKSSASRQFSFSIDFGTTNTHIEYSVEGCPAQPFDITIEDQQLGMLHTQNDETYNHLAAAKFGKGATLLLENVPKELMPEFVGPKTIYQFPRRTVVSESLTVDLNSDTYPFADFSIYWQYDNGGRARQLRHHTNLKWSNISERPETGKRIEGYIANLILLLRNKVVLNGGDLSRTRIIWFYPTSMSTARLHAFENIWEKMVAQYIGPDIALTRLPESVAPFYYFREREGAVAGNHPVINIDIGGGTTDVVVYKGMQIDSYTSFKFAGNVLFGDGYKSNPKANGFVQFFEQYCRSNLGNSILAQHLPAAESIDHSGEFITNLFGLQNHPDRGEVTFSFTEKLRETEELKIIPLLFISSIFYHVACYQKAQGGAVPRYITFSGTASKMLHILDASKGLKSIQKLANQVFNDVFESSDAAIELKIAAGPKEVTAKGGLENPVVPTVNKSVLFGTEDILKQTTLSYREAAGELSRKAIVQEVTAFIDLFFTWNSKIDFSNEFALNTRRFADFKKELKTDLDIFLSEGIAEQQQEMNKQEDEVMDETLFFMPLRGVLNRLAYWIISNK
jgi:hypothetical protein